MVLGELTSGFALVNYLKSRSANAPLRPCGALQASGLHLAWYVRLFAELRRSSRPPRSSPRLAVSLTFRHGIPLHFTPRLALRAAPLRYTSLHTVAALQSYAPRLRCRGGTAARSLALSTGRFYPIKTRTTVSSHTEMRCVSYKQRRDTPRAIWGRLLRRPGGKPSALSPTALW